MYQCKGYNFVEPFAEPVELLTNWREKGLLDTEGVFGNNSLMKDSEIAFLCGLIREKRPNKIVEVGVAAGGTSAVILNCIQMLGLDSQMFSVDLSEFYYAASKKKDIGYLVSMAAGEGINVSRHKTLLGKVVAERIAEIGVDIDFLILDTTHYLPGEVLDFLVLFPYLCPDAVVVLHDVRRHFYVSQSYATNVLFNTVTADKYIDNTDGYPNIAAFKINEDTSKYILNVFAGLMMPWYYIPSNDMLEAYERVMKTNYPESFIQLYEQAKNESRRLLASQKPYMDLRADGELSTFENVLLYGTNDTAEVTIKYLRENKISVKGYVVSDGFGHEAQRNGLPIWNFSEIPFDVEDTFILLTSAAAAPEKVLMTSRYRWAKIRINQF